MKRNLFAVLLAAILVTALVFITAPDAKAATITAVAGETYKITENGTILDLNGQQNVTVHIASGITLSVIDSANTKKDGSTAGTLTKTGDGIIAPTAQDSVSKMRYVAIEEKGIYSFHPFNLTFSKLGINTLANNTSTPDDSTDTTVAICLRGTFFTNDKVLKSGIITDYGICPVVNGIPDTNNLGSAFKKYPFGDKNVLDAYFDLNGSLDVDNIDNTSYYCTYMVINGKMVYSSALVKITPREVLKQLNRENAQPNTAQKDRLEKLFETNNRVANILTNMQSYTETKTLSFADKAQRTEFSTTKQVWSQNGVTLTNEKGDSTSNVADYANPVRLYANSKVTVEASGITKIVFTCNSSSHVTPLANSIGTITGASVNTSGSTVTFTYTNPVDSLVIAKLTAQVQLKSIAVTANIAPECTHNWHTESSCTKDAICFDCDINLGKADHVEGIAANCTTGPICKNCTAEYDSPLGHNYVDGKCTICGVSEPTTEPETPAEAWTKTDIADIKSTDIVVIVWTANGKSYAISNNNGTSSAPTAVVVTVDGNKLTSDIADNIKWNITNESGTLTIYPNGTTATWLYCTSSNNGVRVGTNTNKTFTIDSATGYLKHTGTSRYLGVYTANPDVRCYTSITTNIANQTLAFYVYNSGTAGGETPDTPACEHTNTTTTTVDATCTAAGSKTVTCDDCGETVSTEEIAALGHTTENGVCGNCGETIGSTTPSEPELVEKTYSYIFTAKQFSANETKTLNNVSWTLAGDGGYWGYDGTKGQQFGSGSKPYKSLTLTSTEFSNVKKITINTSGASSVAATLKVYVGNTLVKTISLTATATAYEIDVAGITGTVKFEYTQTSSKALYIKSIVVDYAE